MSIYRYGDSLAGFNYEMMKGMAALYGDHVKFYPIASINEALDELQRGKYDVVISDLPITASRRESFRFTEPVYLDKQVLISRDTTIRSRLDLARERVSVAVYGHWRIVYGHVDGVATAADILISARRDGRRTAFDCNHNEDCHQQERQQYASAGCAEERTESLVSVGDGLTAIGRAIRCMIVI